MKSCALMHLVGLTSYTSLLFRLNVDNALIAISKIVTPTLHENLIFHRPRLPELFGGPFLLPRKCDLKINV